MKLTKFDSLNTKITNEMNERMTALFENFEITLKIDNITKTT